MCKVTFVFLSNILLVMCRYRHCFWSCAAHLDTDVRPHRLQHPHLRPHPDPGPCRQRAAGGAAAAAALHAQRAGGRRGGVPFAPGAARRRHARHGAAGGEGGCLAAPAPETRLHHRTAVSRNNDLPCCHVVLVIHSWQSGTVRHSRSHMALASLHDLRSTLLHCALGSPAV